MNAAKPCDERDLHAFVDGRLDPQARAEVEAWLAENQNDAARVQAYQRQNTSLHELFDPVLDEPIPDGLRDAARVTSQPRPMPSWARLAAAIALFVLGGLSGWGLHGLQTQSEPAAAFAGNAVGAHLVYVSEVRHPVEVGADQEAHLVKWLSKRLGSPLRAPQLGAAGYNLVGGRLLPDDGKPAAQFMFEDASGQRLTVYVRTAQDGEDTAFRFVSTKGVSAFYWVDAPLAYALSGNLPREKLLTLANIVYDDLDKP